MKQAILELDPRTEEHSIPPSSNRLDADGLTTSWADLPTVGRLAGHEYAIFDFSAVREPGMYVVQYGEQRTPPFAIHPQVYQHNVWQPTLETYFPCRCATSKSATARASGMARATDDALQAPAPHVHFDGYRQYDATDTPYAPGAHIPHLDVGGLAMTPATTTWRRDRRRAQRTRSASSASYSAWIPTRPQ